MVRPDASHVMMQEHWKELMTKPRRATRDKESALRCATVEPLEERRLLAVFTVTSTADAGTGSLRWAMDQSNATAGFDTIAFNIAGAEKTIHVTSELFGFYDAALVDGTTQPGYAGKPLVRVAGSWAAGAIDGIKLYGGCTPKGLSVTGFGSQGGTTVPPDGRGKRIHYN